MNAKKKPEKWIAVDLDGTLAEYHGHVGIDHIGAPIPKMVERVKQWRRDGRLVKIFTARMCMHGQWDDEAAKREHDQIVAMLSFAGADYESLKKTETFRRKQELRDTHLIDALTPIQAWCEEHIGERLPVTNVKDLAMGELWDDRCIQVVANTGERVGNEPSAGGRPQSIDTTK